MGAYYTNLSSAPRWFKKTLFPILKTSRTTRLTVFFFLLVSAVAASVWGGSHGRLLLCITLLCIGIAGLLSVVFTDLYGKPCDASHKGKPWVIEEHDGGDGGLGIRYGDFSSAPRFGLMQEHEPHHGGRLSTASLYRGKPWVTEEHNSDDGDGSGDRLGTHYTDFSSAPRWFKTLLSIRLVINIFFFFLLILVWSSGGWLLGMGMVIIHFFFTSLFKSLYGEPCDASHKGKPWVIEYYEGGGPGGGGPGGGCGGGGCGGD